MTPFLTDIHMHLLWDLDDGPETAEDMHKMLAEAHDQGYKRIYATPHVCPGYVAFDQEKYEIRLNEAQQYCISRGWDIEILPGAEVAWTYQTADALRRGDAPPMGQTDYVLMELLPNISYQEALRAVRTLNSTGYTPIIAHVERCRCFLWAPRKALRFREETGALFQMNAGTLLHPKTLSQLRMRNLLLKHKAIDAIATDAHGTPQRPVNLLAAYEWLIRHVGEAYAGKLTSFPSMTENA